jgi:N6-adenosine-specific RNA methylase IME4/ParB-like chromosome segregation protein Spo0J
MTDIRTSYERATAGFDPEFRDALVAEITDVIAKASIVSDANVMAIRTGETADAHCADLHASADAFDGFPDSAPQVRRRTREAGPPQRRASPSGRHWRSPPRFPAGGQRVTIDMAAADPRPALCAPLDGIRVGTRHRRDMGDIAGLAASMAELGLLQPVVVRPDGLLIAGERRLRAAESNGWKEKEIPVTVVDLDNIARGEFAENAIRKDFTLSEAVAIKRALEPLEKAVAKERMRAGKPSGNLPKGRAANKAAKATGMARRTLEKAEAIVDAAEAEPEKFGKLLADMDRTGRANGVYRRLKIAKQAEQIRAEPPPLPGNGPYRVAVIDPAWPYELRDEDPSHRGVRDYPSQSIEQICAVNVGSILHVHSIVLMWVTNFVLVQGVHTTILRAWGLEPKTLITWPKAKWGNGDWLRSQTEHVILAVRGEPVVESASLSTLLKGPFHLVRKNAHSAKPKEFYDFVESLCPAPRYADLFSRYRHNDKWDCHGDEAPKQQGDNA